MFETNDQLVVKASVPGVNPENLDVTVQGDTLTIKGETKEEREGQQGRYHFRERRQGAFSRSVTLPYPIQSDKVEASFENGVLTLTLPKAEEIKPRSIKVQVMYPRIECGGLQISQVLFCKPWSTRRREA